MILKKIAAVMIVVGICAQFILFAAVILRRECALRYGELCRFETAPVDPFDAFRGQYVQLDYKALTGGVVTDRSFARNTWCYLLIAPATNGYAVVASVTDKRPASGCYIKARVQWSSEDYQPKPEPDNKYHTVKTGKWRVHFLLPFSRYYMPEKLAPKAEDAYRRANRSAAAKAERALARVRVWKGMAVIEDIEINGKPIRVCIDEALKKEP